MFYIKLYIKCRYLGFKIYSLRLSCGKIIAWVVCVPSGMIILVIILYINILYIVSDIFVWCDI